MRWILFMVANLFILTSYGLEPVDPWINDLQQSTQNTEFMSNLGQDEIFTHLMQHEDPSNPLFGQTTAQGLVTKASDSINGAAANQYLEQVSSINGEISQEKSKLKEETDENLSQSINSMLQDGFLNGQKITLNPNEPILLHAKRLQNESLYDKGEGLIPVDTYSYEEHVCQENVHHFTQKVKESLIIDFEEAFERKQDVSLYAAAHNEFSVTITANLLSGVITSDGNGPNTLHTSSRVVNPLGTLTSGSIVEFKRTKPYEFWGGQTESVQATLGAEPSQNNGYQFAFGLTQTNCNKKNKALCNQYRGMQHHWEATIVIPPKVTGEHWSGAEKLQPLINKRLCKQVDSRCLGMPDSRQFGKGVHALSVKRDCWEKETTYQCVLRGQHQNSCQEYKSRGCEQIGSLCKESQNNVCTLYEQRYRCPLNHESALVEAKLDLESLGKGGYQLEFELNNDFGQALSALSLATSFAKESLTQDGQQGAFFVGQPGECEVLPKQCCARKGVVKKLLGCSEEEETLASKVQNGICYLVEETQKGILHQKKRHYCCFNSKLARVAQVGARLQLGFDFGKSEALNCRALTVAEIQRVDWGRIDFSEIALDFAQKAQQTKLSDASKLHFVNAVNDNQEVSTTALAHNINPKIEQLKNQTPNTINVYYQEYLQREQHD